MARSIQCQYYYYYSQCRIEMKNINKNVLLMESNGARWVRLSVEVYRDGLSVIKIHFV